MNFKKSLFLWAAALLFTTSAVAQVKKKTTPSTAHKTTPGTAKQQTKPVAVGALPVDPDVIIGKLPNGLTYYIRNNAQQKGRAELFLVNKGGSVVETDAQQGMANFTQRMAFKGTRDFSKDNLISYLKNLRTRFGPDTSAYATYEETVYQLNLPTDTAKIFADGFKLMANWAAYMTFNQADVNSEKAIVAEQIRIGGKTPQERLQLQTLPILLNNSRYAQRFPTGKENTVKGFTDAALKSFYADWYRPDLQAIIVVGDFDPKQVEDMIKFNFSALRNPAAEKPLQQYSVPAIPGTAVKFVTDKDFPYTLIQVVVKQPQTIVKTQADFMQNMRISLFNQLLNARIAEITQVSAPPILFGQAGYGAFTGKQNAFTALAVANTSGLEVAVKSIIGETERIRKFGFTLTEVERAKQAALAQISNSFAQKDNTPSTNFVGLYERNFLTGQSIPGIDYEYNYYINNIGKITVNEINALAAKYITDQNRVILIEAPDSEKGKLPTGQTLLQWIADADKGLVAYVDERSTPLITVQPVAGKVVSSKTDTTLLVENITLSNGVKVILKPTQNTNNQILFTGYSFGGTSLANDQDFTSANLSSTVISNSGVAGFNQTLLDKMLNGRNLSVKPYIGETTQGVSGYSALQDFKTAMELVYLYFTNPRKDADVWATNINQAKSLIAHKSNNPGSVYQDTILAVLNSYNPREMSPTMEQLNAASLDRAFSFYKDRFADASNFTFTFTGNFLIADITPYLEQYLGSLPVTNHKETYKKLGIHPPAGQITKTVYKGVSDKATVQLVFSGAYDYNSADNVQMDALEEVLNIRLADSIKAESGVLSAGVRASYVKFPESRYKITISFLCDANNVDRPMAYVLNELNKIKQNGPVAKDVQKFVLKEARTFQSQLKQNAFWEASLTAAAQNGEDSDNILKHMQYLELVTAQTTKDIANKYLNNNNLIKLILLPEKK
ncbi:M16 family metallopeptidase [Mucilaginibacter sp.]|uniref:M16 family metallopeptidase n=1 Tax=Mucilaginibacter sp. TaxID=1882438 RepID=UPI00261ED583|nr:M16 family metallopeptidase [Mucilaginibacter sp.]MDB5031822.1 peptidase [Mucilaginibacter sp.]